MIDVSRTVSGPIPPAKQLAAYRDIDPRLPARIVEWAEQEGSHRRMLEQRAVDAEIAGAEDLWSITKRSQAFGLSLGIMAIAGGVTIAWVGDGNASVIGGSLLSGVALDSLVWGPRQKPAALPLNQTGQQRGPSGDR